MHEWVGEDIFSIMHHDDMVSKCKTCWNGFMGSVSFFWHTSCALSIPLKCIGAHEWGGTVFVLYINDNMLYTKMQACNYFSWVWLSMCLLMSVWACGQGGRGSAENILWPSMSFYHKMCVWRGAGGGRLSLKYDFLYHTAFIIPWVL